MKSPYRIAKDIWQLLPQGPADRVRQSRLFGPLVRRLSARLIEKATHDEIYDARYYDYIDDLAARAAPIMATGLLEQFSPRTLVDVGCGTGAFLAELQRRGVTVHGLEHASAGIARTRAKGVSVAPVDLRSPARPSLPWPRADLVTSFEVAEHLPAELAERYVDVLTSLGDRVIMTAAIPGQGGLNHINEQPNEYWISKLQTRGFVYDGATSNHLRSRWREGLKDQLWYAENLMVFRHV